MATFKQTESQKNKAVRPAVKPDAGKKDKSVKPSKPVKQG